MRHGGGRDLERQLTVVLLAAAIAAALLAARNGLAPVQRPLTFGLVFWAGFSLAYAVAGLGAFAAAMLVARAFSMPRLRHALPTLLALIFLLGVLPVNGRALRGLLALSGPERYRWLLPAAVVLAAAGLVAAVLDRRRVQRMLAVAALAVAAVAFWPPRAPRGATPGGAERARAAGQRFLLIGLDGGDWRYLDPLIARGALPNRVAL